VNLQFRESTGRYTRRIIDFTTTNIANTPLIDKPPDHLTTTDTYNRQHEDRTGFILIPKNLPIKGQLGPVVFAAFCLLSTKNRSCYQSVKFQTNVTFQEKQYAGNTEMLILVELSFVGKTLCTRRQQDLQIPKWKE